MIPQPSIHVLPAFRTRRANRLPVPFLHVVAFLCLGCASNRHFEVDALAGPAPEYPLYSYILTTQSTSNGDVDAADAFLSRSVRSALAAHGMHKAPESQVAEIDIRATFATIGPFNLIRTRHEPTYIDMPPVGVPSKARSGDQPTYIVPQGGMPLQNGERTVIYKIPVYRKTLELVARGPKNSAGVASRELWRVTVTNLDRSNDTGLYIRLMTAAAMDMIGTETDSQKDVVLSTRDARVKHLQKYMNL